MHLQNLRSTFLFLTQRNANGHMITCLFPAVGGQTAPGDARLHCITFHSQLRSHLELHLAEVDPFGNHSSPHYKGTAVFYKVTRDQLGEGNGPPRPDVNALGEPVCKLNLTLPKVTTTGPPPCSELHIRGEF